ncbi:hypothetical protein [Jannaschia aquimarina]|uniref:hypothetical protein n=1 Tax=Jannaschia aquimarina TaxID=935700 RepID=UPI0005C68440|nr:hypothetical protein [Jannaschia aquimarina]
MRAVHSHQTVSASRPASPLANRKIHDQDFHDTWLAALGRLEPAELLVVGVYINDLEEKVAPHLARGQDRERLSDLSTGLDRMFHMTGLTLDADVNPDPDKVHQIAKVEGWDEDFLRLTR